MPEPIRIKVRLDGDVADVRALISHPMETGLRKDPANGQAIALHFIKTVMITHNGVVVMEAQWAQAMSRNPYLNVRVRNANPGDEIEISWVDNRGESNAAKAKVPARA